MQLFDLIIIASVLFVVASSLRILWSLLRGRRQATGQQLKRLGAFVAFYLLAVIAVSLFSPQRVFQIGNTRCYDDWCIGVEDAKVVDSIGEKLRPAHGRFLLVTLRVSSRARRVRQSEPTTQVYLLDGKGNRYEVADAAQLSFEDANQKQLPIGTMIDPGQSFLTVRVFEIPLELPEIGLAVRQGGPGLGPSLFLIGDDQSLFHKVSIFLLPLAVDR